MKVVPLFFTSCPLILRSRQGSLHLINSRALREILKCFSTLRRVPFSVVRAVVSFFDMLLFFTAPGCASERTAKTCVEACLEKMGEVFTHSVCREGGGDSSL